MQMLASQPPNIRVNKHRMLRNQIGIPTVVAVCLPSTDMLGHLRPVAARAVKTLALVVHDDCAVRQFHPLRRILQVMPVREKLGLQKLDTVIEHRTLLTFGTILDHGEREQRLARTRLTSVQIDHAPPRATNISLPAP